jgi:protein Tex
MARAVVGEVAEAVARELKLALAAVRAVLELSAEGATVPFVARYRKEATGGLDEVQIRAVVERAEYITALEQRRDTILQSITEQGKLTPNLESALRAAATKGELEDLYLPFKSKRRTRGQTARERGLEPLADLLWNGVGAGGARLPAPEAAARGHVDPAREVPDVAAALAGARDIAAEWLSERAEVRHRARELVQKHALVVVKKAKAHREQVTKFDAYAEFQEPLRSLPSHRVLAIERGCREGILKSTLDWNQEPFETWCLSQLPGRVPPPWQAERQQFVADAVARLIVPSAENEVQRQVNERAETEAIGVFAANLRELLLAAPLGGKRVLAIDPGQRTGCKCAVLDPTGKLLDTAALFLVQGPAQLETARRTLRKLLGAHRVQAVAVGNGTHGRETLAFVREVLAASAAELEPGVFALNVNEAGASVYSASDVARAELPDLDVTVRGAVSIGRRLQDPLAELVKIEPKSIGVGQYQHDVDQTGLANKLAEVVESCVNQVGVELNTASAELLSYVAGVGPKLAQAIVAERDRSGPFASRQALLAVKGLGPRTFEQCAGFLRVRTSSHPLDASAVHPERYALVERMAKDSGVPLRDLVGKPERVAQLSTARYISAEVGDYTLADILAELKKPGRDPRASFEAPQFDASISKIEDLREGLVLEGCVTNVTAFGAFVDIGVHQDGLVHISELADHFVKDPAAVVKVGQRLRVRVLGVEAGRNRIRLSAKGLR